MNREEFDKLYLGKAVHCDTEGKANHFLALADNVGYEWSHEVSLVDYNQWEKYGTETCYEVTKSGLYFADTRYFNLYNHRFTGIVDYTLQPKFKVGDKARVKNTIFTTLNGEVGVVVDADPLSPLTYYVKVGDDEWTLWFYENQLEKVEEQICEEETIDGIIEEIEYHQKAINVLHNRLKMKAKVK